MVFSFFKKQPQKMPERTAVKPKAAVAPRPSKPIAPAVQVPPAEALGETLPELEFSRSQPAGLTNPVPVSKSAKPAGEVLKSQPLPTDDGFELDFTISEFDRNYSDSSVMGINVDHDVDSMQADIEQVAVLYSNGQDPAARALLEAFVKIYRDSDGFRIWQMLFDLLQLTGDRPAFDKLGMEFVEHFETSPPTWRNLAPAIGQVAPGMRSIALQGVTTSDNMSVLAPLASSLADKRPVRIDCSKWVGCDDEIAGLLAQQLLDARKAGVSIILDQVESFIPRLRSRFALGDPSHPNLWLLVLELLQRYGTQEQFEECAIDYAVTFERSPPSWEVIETSTLPNLRNGLPEEQRDAHYLSGEIKNVRFDELPAILESMESPRLDFSAVRRLDFFSAGQLANRIAPLKDAGRDVVIRNPNHLVAELLGVVGINRIARIIVPKS